MDAAKFAINAEMHNMTLAAIRHEMLFRVGTDVSHE